MKKAENVVVGALCDQGKVRDTNEDRSFYHLFEYNCDGRHGIGLVAAVADGMGGHAAGEAASERAVQVLQSKFASLSNSRSEGGAPIKWADLMSEAITEANREVYNEAQRWEGKAGMGTTLTAAALVGSDMYIGHVGDSRAYLFHQGSLKQITDDDTWAADQVRRGVMTEEEAAKSDKANQLMRVLGFKENVKVSVKALNLTPGDVVILCTDGLWGVLTDEEMAHILRRSRLPQSTCAQMVRLANRKGAPDNIAVLVIAYRPEAALRHARISQKSTRKRMVAGLAAVLVMLTADIIYLISQYSKMPKPPEKPARAVRLVAPVSVKEKDVPPPAPKAGSPRMRPVASGSAVADEKADDGLQEPPVPELTMRDLSGETIRLSQGGEGQ